MNILDLAPTILYLLDVPIPVDLDGYLITDVISDQYMREHPVRYGDQRANPLMGEYNRQDEEMVAARLRDLGYL